MKITYIYQSGFAIEYQNITIIIDYFRDSGVKRYEGIVHEQLLNRSVKLYVLSSHAHPDHFNSEILTWKENHPDIQYVFSKDILDAGKAKSEDAVYLDKYAVYQDNLLKIKAFGSTDIGVSFLIELDGKRIFHAGDLNNWHWKEESTPEEIREAEDNYLLELYDLAKDVDYIDVAMFPVDARLGKDYMLGAQQFIDRIRTGLFIPMHFGEKYHEAAAFKGYAESKGVRFAEITHKGQCVYS
ncbi:MAG: MBL fold metallo-hydrolase [Dysgonamonadaceae bacterium]|jgi:L-ascorbate metabolism protein UlaG (beta-lactamase superfamily)|nr:MBL fold metallo-hydrolase [Dysgonamonadaceae bacterium]